MKKYRATVTYSGVIEVEVEADSISEASQIAEAMIEEMDEREIVAGIGAIYTDCVDEIDDEQEDEE